MVVFSDCAPCNCGTSFCPLSCALILLSILNFSSSRSILSIFCMAMAVFRDCAPCNCCTTYPLSCAAKFRLHFISNAL